MTVRVCECMCQELGIPFSQEVCTTTHESASRNVWNGVSNMCVYHDTFVCLCLA